MLISLDPAARDNVTEELDLIPKQFRLLPRDEQRVLPQRLQDKLDVLAVLLRVLGPDDDIIHVHVANRTNILPQPKFDKANHVHHYVNERRREQVMNGVGVGTAKTVEDDNENGERRDGGLQKV